MFDQIGRQYGESFVSPLRPSVFDADVFSFGETAFIKATMEGLNNVSEVSRFLSVEKTDHWDRGRLRTRPKRPQDRHSRERAEKIPALHVSQHLIQRDTPAGF